MTTQQASFQLPVDIVEALNHFARERHESPDRLVAEALRVALNPLQQQAMQRLNAQVSQQSGQDLKELYQHRNARLPYAVEGRLAELLELKRERDLSESEQFEIQGIFDRIEEVATERAAAIELLNKRASAH